MKNKEMLLNKIRELSERGVDGEKQNATELLDKLMKKYSVTEKEVESEEYVWHTFQLDKKYYQFSFRLFYQLLFSSYLKSTTDQINGSVDEDTKIIRFLCPTKAALEAEAKYNFYFEKLVDALNLTYEGFIDRNRLYFYGKDIPKLNGEEQFRRWDAQRVGSTLPRFIYEDSLK